MTTQEDWTTEPWLTTHARLTDVGDWSIENDTEIIGDIYGLVGETPRPAEANARRIVACVNACAGISNEALRSGAIGELVEALKLAIPELTAWSNSRDFEDVHGDDEEDYSKALRSTHDVLDKLEGKEVPS